jgi:hypothetical protein
MRTRLWIVQEQMEFVLLSSYSEKRSKLVIILTVSFSPTRFFLHSTALNKKNRMLSIISPINAETKIEINFTLDPFFLGACVGFKLYIYRWVRELMI